jgi:hypothetical protein
MLDGADPALLAPCFKRTEELLLEPAMREALSRLGGRTLVALDGTEYFCSQKIACPHCQTRKRSNPADPGEGPRALELPDPVRNRENPSDN